MHLFALLIATVFSTQFVAPNPAAAEITVSPAALTARHTVIKLLSLEPDDGTTWADSMYCKLVTADSQTSDEITLAKVTAEPLHWDLATVDLAAKGITLKTASFPIKVKVSATSGTGGGTFTPLAVEGEITLGVPDFTVAPLTVAASGTATVTVTHVTGTAWTEGVKLYFTDDINDVPEVDDIAMVTASEPGPSNGNIWAVDDHDFAGVTRAAGKPVYVFVQHGPDGDEEVLPIPAFILVENDFVIESDVIYTDTNVITNLVVTPPIPKWANCATGANDKVTVYVSKAPVAAPASYTEWIGHAESTEFADGVYKIASLAIPAHGVAADADLYFHVKYVKGDETAAWDTHEATVNVETAAAQYTVSPATLPFNHLSVFRSITIAPEATFDLGEEISVKISANAVGATPLIVPATVGDDDKYLVEFTPAQFLAIKPTAAASEVYNVEVSTAATGTGFLSVKKTLTLAAAGDYTASPAQIEKKDWVLNAPITITQTEQWAADRKVVVSLSGTRTGAATADDVAVSLTHAAGNSINFAVPQTVLTKFPGETRPLTLFLYVVAESTAISGTPTHVTIIDNIPLFTVNPSTLVGKELEEDIDFQVTPKATAGWTTNTMTVTFSLDDEPPTEPADVNAIPFTFPLVAPQNPNLYYTVTADLKALPVDEDTSTIYVWIAKAGVYESEYREIAFTPATTWTIPATSVTFSDDFKVSAIAVTPVPLGHWADLGNKLKFCYTVVAPASNTPVDNITGIITKTGSGSGATYSIPEQSLTGFELAATDLPKRLLVEITEDDWVTKLSTTAHIALVAGTEPEETTFTLTPNEINWAAEVKLLETEIKPTPEEPEGWPTDPEDDTMLFQILNPAAATVAAVPGTVTIKVDEDEETVQWFIPADTNIKTLVADEPSADVPLTVKISIDDGTTWITKVGAITVKAPGKPASAAMGISPLLSLLAALVFLFVKLF